MLAAALLAALGLAGMADMAQAAPGGRIATMPIGHYLCELPGGPLAMAGVPQPEEDFAIIHSSRYTADGGPGTYLLTGDMLQLTSGPRHGARYRRVSENFLRKLHPDGSESNLRCVRGVPNNGG